MWRAVGKKLGSTSQVTGYGLSLVFIGWDNVARYIFTYKV
jgi:hypothetical protein